MRKTSLVATASIAILQLGCSGSEQFMDESTASATAALTANPTIVGFEALAGWTRTSGSMALDTQHTEGSYALSLSGFSYSRVASVPFAIGPVRSNLSVDLRIPTEQPNPYWYGALQAYLSAPSVGVNSQYLGQVDLKTLTPGQFGTVDFTLPSSTALALAQGAPDVGVAFVLNVPAGNGMYLLDHLQLEKPQVAPAVPLPTGIHYADEAPYSTQAATTVRICPSANPTCATPFHTTLVMQVNGRPFTGGFLYFPWQDDNALTVLSGGQALSTGMMTFAGPRVEIDSYTNQGIPLTYYSVAPVWGGTTVIDFEATTLSNAEVQAVFFRHPSYDTGTAFPDLLARAAQATIDARAVTGVPGVRPISLFSPAEISVGDGNFWDGRVNVNYGNPPWIDGRGGIPRGLVDYALQEYTHEYTHALFDQVWSSFPSDSACLNEGLANAVDVVIGTAPPSKLGPQTSAVPSGTYDGDCRPLTDPHDVGSCYFYHVYKAGMLSGSFLRNVFHPQRTYSANFCHPTQDSTTTTGNSLVVLFTEAAGGTDMTAIVNSMQLRNSGSYAAAKSALGF